MQVNDSGSGGFSGLGRALEPAPTSPSGTLRGASKGGKSLDDDQISLSSLGSVLSGAQVDSDAQAARIRQLSAAVGAGEYQVDPRVLSNSIIQQSLRA